MKANLILPCSAARQITSSTDIASWDAFTVHRSSLGLTTWCHDVVCCSGVTEYNRAGTLQWYVSCKNVAIFYFTLDSHGIDVGETPNDITLVLTMKLLSPRVIQPCNTARLDCTLDSGKSFSKKVWIKLLDQTEMGYNDVRCELERVFPQTSTELGMWLTVLTHGIYQ
jgi:hypothetical protein